MVVLFVFFFLLSVTVTTGFPAGIKRWAVFVIPVYFCVIQEMILQLSSTVYPNLAVKFLLFLSVGILPCVALWFAGIRRMKPLVIALPLCFVCFLPFSRPTQTFLLAGTSWKLKFVQERFMENLSRQPPSQNEVRILKAHCGLLTAASRAKWIGRSKRFVLPPYSNECIRRSQKNSLVVALFPSPAESGKELSRFKTGSSAERVRLLEEARATQNSALIQDAIGVVDSAEEDLVIAAVRYLRSRSGKLFPADQRLWQDWFHSSVGNMQSLILTNAKTSPAAQRGFSAVEAMNTLAIAQENQQDFLSSYLSGQFPKSVSSHDLLVLNNSIRELTTDSPSVKYRRGMLYFFLALCRTKMLADGQNLEADLAAESWIAASEDLNQSPELGRSMWEEINKIMNEADRDRDGKLDKSELISIIKKRSP